MTSQTLIRMQLFFSRPDLKKPIFGVFEAKYLWKYLSFHMHQNEQSIIIIACHEIITQNNIVMN